MTCFCADERRYIPGLLRERHMNKEILTSLGEEKLSSLLQGSSNWFESN